MFSFFQNDAHVIIDAFSLLVQSPILSPETLLFATTETWNRVEIAPQIDFPVLLPTSLEGILLWLWTNIYGLHFVLQTAYQLMKSGKFLNQFITTRKFKSFRAGLLGWKQNIEFCLATRKFFLRLASNILISAIWYCILSLLRFHITYYCDLVCPVLCGIIAILQTNFYAWAKRGYYYLPNQSLIRIRLNEIQSLEIYRLLPVMVRKR